MFLCGGEGRIRNKEWRRTNLAGGYKEALSGIKYRKYRRNRNKREARYRKKEREYARTLSWKQ
jgi:hypothetical protein